MAEKTNMEYLKEFIKDNDEALEFWEAVQDEIKDLEKELDDATDRIDDLEKGNEEQESEIEELQEALDSDANLEEIDCGIGSIFYREPDNLQLQSLMEDFKEKHQVRVSKRKIHS